MLPPEIEVIETINRIAACLESLPAAAAPSCPYPGTDVELELLDEVAKAIEQAMRDGAMMGIPVLQFDPPIYRNFVGTLDETATIWASMMKDISDAPPSPSRSRTAWSLRIVARGLRAGLTAKAGAKLSGTEEQAGVRHDVMGKGADGGERDQTGFAGARELADRWGLPRDSTRKKLDRWRTQNPMSKGYTENVNRARHEPQYLYDPQAVGFILNKTKRPSNVHR